MKVAFLDDYQDVARKLGDWSLIEKDVDVTSFTDHLADEDAVQVELHPARTGDGGDVAPASDLEDPFAEVNDREVHVGSVVDGFEVTDIAKTSVTLENGTRTVVLRVR